MVIYSIHAHEWEDIAYRAVCTHRAFLVELRILEIHLVRVGRIHPPCVDTHLVEIAEVFPVDVASLRRIAVINSNS